MKRILFPMLSVVLLASACSGVFPFSAPAVQPAAVSELPQPSPTVKSTAIPTFTPRPEVIPSPTFTPPVTPIDPIYRIEFGPDGTYTDVIDSIPTGESRVYSVSAAQGQVMSISSFPQVPDGSWGYLSMKITGTNGVSLCPLAADQECTFWRGELPASQEYFVTLTANGEIPEFSMRIAINPPGKSVQYFEYRDLSAGISMIYPDAFAPAVAVTANNKLPPQLSLHYIESAQYEQTNLSEVYLILGSSAEAQAVAACADANAVGGAMEVPMGTRTVNGLEYTHFSAEGAGAGNYYLQEIFRAAKNGRCYEVIYFIHYTNIGNYPPGVVTEFDQQAILDALDGIFETLKVK